MFTKSMCVNMSQYIYYIGTIIIIIILLLSFIMIIINNVMYNMIILIIWLLMWSSPSSSFSSNSFTFFHAFEKRRRRCSKGVGGLINYNYLNWIDLTWLDTWLDLVWFDSICLDFYKVINLFFLINSLNIIILIIFVCQSF